MSEEMGERGGGEAEDVLDPMEAARLLEQTGEEARRHFEVRSPGASLLTAALVLLAYGILWLSVRGQHPYVGPGQEAVAAVIGVVAASLIATAILVDRARRGVSGRTSRTRHMEIAALVAGYVGILTMEGALAHAGAGDGVAFGVFAAVAPLLVIGVALMAISAAGPDWSLFGLGLWLILGAAGSGFAGPVGVWAVAGLSGCLGFAGRAAAEAWWRGR